MTGLGRRGKRFRKERENIKEEEVNGLGWRGLGIRRRKKFT